MSFSSTDALATTMPPPASRRKRWLPTVFLLVALLASGLWWAWPWYETPTLPDFAFEAADPAVMEAVETARQAVLDEPRSAAAFARQAARWAYRATQLQADHAFAHLYLGLARWRLGQRDEALKALRTAVRCRSDFVETHLYLAEVLAEAGQLGEARACLENARRLAPNDPRLRAASARLEQASP
jgi:tetratricopeptide (TPR) repeat protein